MSTIKKLWKNQMGSAIPPFRPFVVLLWSAITVLQVVGYNNGVGRTPALGWNSWNTFLCDVSEKLIKEMADAMVSSGLRDAGFEYVIIDDCWSLKERDANGALQADPVTFPSGIPALADYVHSLGLKLGIYSDFGTLTCAKRAGSYGHYEQDAKTFADWGIDYLKFDTCNRTPEEKKDPQPFYADMSKAMNATGRPMIYSMCNWGRSDPWEWAPAIAHSWRTTQDLYPQWNRMVVILDKTEVLAPYAAPYAFNDPDMLEYGVQGTIFNNPHAPATNLTQREGEAHLSLWSLLSAPLILGLDVRTLTANDKALLTNPRWLGVNQDELGRQATRVAVTTQGIQLMGKCVGTGCVHTEVWAKPLVGGGVAIGAFNRGDDFTQYSGGFKPETILVEWGVLQRSGLAIPEEGRGGGVRGGGGVEGGCVKTDPPPAVTVTDVWSGEVIVLNGGGGGGFKADGCGFGVGGVQPHEVRLLQVTPVSSSSSTL